MSEIITLINLVVLIFGAMAIFYYLGKLSAHRDIRKWLEDMFTIDEQLEKLNKKGEKDEGTKN